ncbi:prepilin-type N-terminal cleavage/methylation domain-containing protein [Serratia sp. M24T3]|uniref:prepilin-type N-terminal cleavage/methylation domain-containing protein n=1 Tax=Serratia sp. M24T3 TaxID=932213 RepID=UPI00025B9BC4|nr:prepilin-type N-terminal cleavage/methylation domain-containing protein [Serratia sp. M24T3]EIC84256.1 prepilin peptidase dependent protein c [Serratia sp. M24T3]
MNKLSVEKNQTGLSLPETLIAMLLLSISVLGLLHYYQSLSQGFTRQWQVRQAWSEAHEQLESFAITGKGKVIDKIGWRVDISLVQMSPACQQVTATVTTPMRYTSQLSRLICKPIDDF